MVSVAMIEIYEDITDELVPRISAELTAADGEDIELRICSGGGSVFAGHAIVSRLRSYIGKVVGVVDGLAASAASFIAVAGCDELVMSQGSELMIHEAAMSSFGSSADFRKSADDLERWTTTIAKTYAAKAGGDVEHWLELMAAETWFSAEDAVASGLADRVQSEPVPVAAVGAMTQIVAKYHYNGRGDSPPGDKKNPKEENMSWNALAKELGVSEDELKSKLTSLVKNEAVKISGEVDVTYPSDLTIVPTETIRVEPIVGDAAPAEGDTPAEEGAAPTNSAAVEMAANGIEYAMGDVAEGFTADVDAATGVVTIKAPSGAEVGTTAAFTVKANDADVALSVKVRSLSDDDNEAAADSAEESSPAPAEPTNQVTLDRDTYNLLVSQAKQGAQAASDKAREARISEVDNWIAEGRVAAAQRDKVLSVMHENEALAREVYGANPKNTIPMTEVGHVGAGMPKSKAEELLAKADSIRNNKKGS